AWSGGRSSWTWHESIPYGLQARARPCRSSERAAPLLPSLALRTGSTSQPASRRSAAGRDRRACGPGLEQVADAHLLGQQAAEALRLARHVRAAELSSGGVGDDVGPRGRLREEADHVGG